MKKFVFPLVFGLTLSGYAVYSVLDTLVIPDPNAYAVEDEIEDTKAPDTENAIIKSDEYSRYYKSDDLEVKITKETVKTKDKDNGNLVDTIVFCADVHVSEMSHFRGRFAIRNGQPTFGVNIKSKTSEIAENGNAIFAISGDNYAGRKEGYVVRNGKSRRDTPRKDKDADQDLVIWNDGSFDIIKETETPLSEVMNNPLGAWQVFSFGPALVVNSTIAVKNDDEITTGIAKTGGNQRSVLGIIEPLHYFITVSEGRLPDSYGQSLYEAAEFIKSKGVKTAYNLDGGGSATIWFRGEVLNRPKDANVPGIGEREIGDAILFK